MSSPRVKDAADGDDDDQVRMSDGDELQIIQEQSDKIQNDSSYSVNFQLEKRAKSTSGRKPVPIREYVQTRKLKIAKLKSLADDKRLTVDERKKYRAQKFALQRRLEEKVKAYEKKKK